MSIPSIPTQLCTFSVGPHEFGVDVAVVREVVRYGIYTRVPRADPAVRGLMSLRGQVLLAVDLRILLGLPSQGSADGRPPLNLVLSLGDQHVALIADRVGDVVTTETNSFEPTPETIPLPLRRLCRGVFKRERGLILLLDVGAAALRKAAA